MKVLALLLFLCAAVSTPISLKLTPYFKDIVDVSVKIGTPGIDTTMFFDMNSNKNWLFGSSCPGCDRQSTYKCSDSTSCISQEAGEITRDNYNLKGIMVTDNIDFSAFRLDMPFLEITEQSGTVPNSFGSIGLGLSSYTTEDHLVKKLIKNGQIEQPIVSLNFETKSESTLMLGGYDTKYTEKKIVWLTVKDEWKIPLQDIAFKNFHSGATSIKIRADIASIVVPKGQYEGVASAIRDNKFCVQNTCTMAEASFINMPSISLKVNDKITWKIDYRYYTKETSRYTELSYCDLDGCYYTTYVVFELTISKGDEWGLGLEGLQHFYTIYDYENSKIGVVFKGMPTNSRKRIYTIVYAVVFSIVGAAIIAAIIAIVVIRRRH
jgi:hypothetical protein